MGLVGCTPQAMENYAECEGGKHPGWDKWKHCWVSCHLDRCLMWGMIIGPIPTDLYTIGIGFGHEIGWGQPGKGWESDDNQSWKDIGSDCSGIVCAHQFFTSCDSCCDKKNPDQNVGGNTRNRIF